MALAINDTAPDFEAETTQGRIRFHDWIGDSMDTRAEFAASRQRLQKSRKLSPGGARVGHASLMRPDRPLPTRLSVFSRYAATRTSPQRLSRLEYPGGIAPPLFMAQSLVTSQFQANCIPTLRSCVLVA